MRIIDKNTDFYDYLQYQYMDTNVTFDRTDSFILTKEIMRSYLPRCHERDYDFILLQVCNTFWLFLLEITEWSESKWNYEPSVPKNYSIELLSTWRDYNKQRKLISVNIIIFEWEVLHRFQHYNIRTMRSDYSKQDIINNTSVLVQAVKNEQFKVEYPINQFTIYNGDGSQFEKHIPILKSCGMAAWIDPLTIFLSIEEYFSLEKQSTERDSSIGITDKEKVENHGFDTKTSFRGKQNKYRG